MIARRAYITWRAARETPRPWTPDARSWPGERRGLVACQHWPWRHSLTEGGRAGAITALVEARPHAPAEPGAEMVRRYYVCPIVYWQSFDEADLDELHPSRLFHGGRGRRRRT